VADRHPQRLAFLIRLVHQAIRRELDAAVRGLGLTMPQVSVLAALTRRSGASNADLARAAFVSAQSMGEILASLEEEALINRTVDKQNNRVLRTTLSAKGAAALKRADREIERIERRTTDALGASDAAVLRALLQRCAAALQSEVAATAVSAPGGT
jgi:DNA-binding MarR family transcriptional regulator